MDWKEEHCSTRPEEKQIIAEGVLLERRNIRQVHHEATDNMPAYDEWVCESREIALSDYQIIKAVEEIDTNAAIDAYTEQLVEEGLL